jgi:hypothetical protein
LTQKLLKAWLGLKLIECGLNPNLGHVELPLPVRLLERLQRFCPLSKSNV